MTGEATPSLHAVSSVMHWVGAKLKFKIGCPFAPASRRRRLSVMDVDGGGAPPHRGRGRGWRGHVAGSPLLIGASECTPPQPTSQTEPEDQRPPTSHQRGAHTDPGTTGRHSHKNLIYLYSTTVQTYKKKVKTCLTVSIVNLYKLLGTIRTPSITWTQ
jgi:hypothetical protein